MQTNIRPYTKADRQACIAAFKTNIPKYFTTSEVTDFEIFLTKIEATGTCGENEKTHYYVITLNENVIGCGGFGHKDGSNNLALAWGLIHNNYHLKGYGAALLLHRLTTIKTKYPTTQLVIDTTQHSYTFFKKFGFETTKVTNNFYEVGMHRYDMVYKP